METDSSTTLAALQAAVRHGDMTQCTTLLGAEPSLASALSPRGGSLLLEAFEREEHGIADAFIAHREDRGITELDIHEACAMGRAGIVQKRLTDDPMVFEEAGPAGFLPLHRAAYRGHTDAVTLLLEMGADPNSRSKNGANLTALHSAVAGAARFGTTDPGTADHREVVRRLLAAGGDDSLQMEGGWTPRSAAERDGVLELLDQESDELPS